MGINNRKHPRYYVRVRAALVRGRNVQWLHTLNVSHRGAFLVTDTPPVLRELIQVKLQLPSHPNPVVFTGMAVHVVQPGKPGVTSGTGVQFYGMGGVDATRWHHFINDLREHHSECLSPDTVLNLEPAMMPEPAKRLSAAHDTKIRIRLRSAEELQRLYSDNVSKGAMLLPADGDVQSGTKLEMVVVHPDNGTSFSLFGVVKKKIVRDSFEGVSIQLELMTPRRQAEFVQFVQQQTGVRSIAS